MEMEMAGLVSAFVAGWLAWFAWGFHTWWRHFSWRVCRSDPSSPSHGHRPLLQPGLAKSGCPVNPVSSTSCPVMAKSDSRPAIAKAALAQRQHLDMDHVHLSLLQYLWAAHWIAIPAMVLVILGWCQIQVARLLKFSGLLREPSEVDLRRMAYHLVLENLCTGVAALEDTKAGSVATFIYSPFPVFLDDRSQVQSEVKTQMVVQLNLTDADFLTAKLDGETCTVSEAVVLLAHYVLSGSHPKMHAYANWGIDPAASGNSYLQKMSVVTACYNHYGFINFPKMANGMVKKDAGLCFQTCVKESLRSGVPEHKLVVALADHSPLLKFIIQLRAPFQEAFREFRKEFPANCSCEAYFLGTVMHSLDHYAMGKTINPWLFSAICVPEHLQSLHGTVLLARCCALEDIPTVGLAKYFRDGRSHFHETVYLAAKVLDPNFADQIQTCVVK